MKVEVIVVGAINHDLVLDVVRRPVPGETLRAGALLAASGGKGANQAAAAARAGARVALVSAVGDDAIGNIERDRLAVAGVDVSEVTRIAGQPTGLAVITVTPDGENAIVIVAGANGAIDGAHVETALARLASSRAVLVLQTELPATVLETAAGRGSAAGARIVVNNGPCIALADAVLRLADPLVVNETEAMQMLGDAAQGSASSLAAALRARCGAGSVIVTLGRNGCCWSDAAGNGHVPAQSVGVVDTTGAGDAFVGTLAAALARGATLPQACTFATQAAAQAVTWKGARPPTVAAEPARDAQEGDRDHAHQVIGQWLDAFRRADIEAITQLYAADATMIGTTGGAVLTRTAEIRGYFDRAFQVYRNAVATLDRSDSRRLDARTVIVAGFDTIEATVGGRKTISRGRVTFVIARRGPDWKIVHLHRSPLQEQAV